MSVNLLVDPKSGMPFSHEDSHLQCLGAAANDGSQASNNDNPQPSLLQKAIGYGAVSPSLATGKLSIRKLR